MSLDYQTGFKESWIDQILELHNKTEMKRPIEQKDFFLKAYQNRYSIVTCWEGSKLIGFGSTNSDGFMYSSIYDVVVDPDYQGQGIGKELMVRLAATVPGTCIHLTSTFGNEEFYQKVGYKKHKTAFAKYPWESEYLHD